MKHVSSIAVLILILAASAGAQQPPLLPESTIDALAQELSGETAKRNLDHITQFHRMRASRQFRAAAEHIAERARAYGLSDVRIEEFPADGKTMFGTQKARPAWDAEFAELWELREEKGQWVPALRLASWEAMPITLAQDSESADVTADLVDVGDGTAESDYAGKDVRGKIVLAGAQPGPVARLAVAKYGAAGIVSYAQNQRTAWWGEDENLVRWGHLDSFAPFNTFAFMVSLKQARGFRQRLGRGETVRLHATVKAGRYPGVYSIVTAAIPGADAKLREEEIVFSCHLDHQKPGANDNASGCVTILEVARALQKLINEKKIAPPARTIRFVWPPEIEGTTILLNARPEWAARIKAAIHMDMVGGGPATKAVFHVTRGPMSVPSFINDVAEAFGEFVNEQSYQFAATGRARWPLVAPEGGKEPLLAQMSPFSMGSDHQVYAEGSWRIPVVYLNDWPDRYIHTNFDLPANIDPTKLKRAAFIGAATGYFLARLREESPSEVLAISAAGILRRLFQQSRLLDEFEIGEESGPMKAMEENIRGLVYSLEAFLPLTEEDRSELERRLRSFPRGPVKGATEESIREGADVFRRAAEPKGPMSVFGYDYFTDHYGEEKARKLKLLSYQGLWGDGGDYAYEVLNFVDGKRNAQQIRDAVSVEFGPISLEYVAEYLRALESIGVVQVVR